MTSAVNCLSVTVMEKTKKTILINIIPIQITMYMDLGSFPFQMGGQVARAVPKKEQWYGVVVGKLMS